MFKLTWRGVVPMEDFELGSRQKRDMNDSKDPINLAEELSLDASDYWAIYLAAMQTIMPIVLFFAAAYFLAILFITKVWIA